MQDKDFDKLFSQKFEDFEVEPSQAVWDNITGELDGKKKAVRSIIPWISIAATVLIVATAGVLFLNNDKPSTTETKPKPVAKVIEPRTNPIDKVVQTETEVPVKPSQVAKVNKVVNANNNSTAVASNTIIPDDVKVNPADVIEPKSTIDTQPIIASVTNPASTQSQAIIPDVQLTPRTLDTDAQTVAEKPVMASAEKQAAAPLKKRGIHNMGGLLNALISTVDKRDNKLIEFSDGDEDDDNATKVTGVNLGLIKIKKQ